MRTTTRIGHLWSSTKNKQNQTNKIQKISCDRSLLSSNTSNHFKLITSLTRGENLWPPSEKWNDDSYLQETKDCKQHTPVTYAK